MPTGTKCLVYTRQNVLGDTNQFYYTGTDADIDTQKTNIAATGQLVDTTPVRTAKELSPIYLDAGGNPFGGVPTGWSYGPATGTDDNFLNHRVWDPGQCDLNILRIAAAVKNLETVTVGVNIFEFNTQAGRNVAPNIPIDCTANGTAAAGTLTSANTGAFTAGKKVTIGTKVYTFRATITGGSVDGDVLIGADGDAGLTNLRAAINLGAGAGTLYASAMTAGPATSGAVTAHTLIITAIAKGTAGNSLAFSTDEAKLSVDAATLGTTTAGVDPTATQGSAAFIIAFNSANTQGLVAERIGNNETVISTSTPAALALACTETMAGANNAWDSATMKGGLAPAVRRLSTQTRVPSTQEVALGNIHFKFDFAPRIVDIVIYPTATPGIVKAFTGAITKVGNRISIANAGGTAWAATDTVQVRVYD